MARYAVDQLFASADAPRCGLLLPFYKRAIAAVRSVDQGKLVWGTSGNVFFNFGADSAVTGLSLRRVQLPR